MSQTIACKKHSPGGAPWGYFWKTEDDVVHVRPEHLAELIAASHGDIYEAVEEVLEDSDPDPLALSKENDELVEPPRESAQDDLSHALSVSDPVKAQPRPRKPRTTKPKTTE